MSILQAKWANVGGGTPIKEVPSGVINSSNAAFVTTQTAILATLFVFVDGAFDTAFTYNSGTKTITLTTAPLIGQNVYVVYRY